MYEFGQDSPAEEEPTKPSQSKALMTTTFEGTLAKMLKLKSYWGFVKSKSADFNINQDQFWPTERCCKICTVKFVWEKK